MNFMYGENLTKQYGKGETAVAAVGGIDFEIQSGEWIAVMGQSGSGKSTLLSIMGGLNSPSSGRYVVDGIDVYRLNTDQRADFRREFLGFVFQSFHLVPYLTALENTMLPLATTRLSRRVKRDMAAVALERVGLSGKEGRLPSQISGGEQERVAIARAIVNEPLILLADEPTGNLDTRTGEEIMDLLRTLNAQSMTIVMVTHSPGCAAYAHRVLRLSDGLVVPDPAVDRERRSAPAPMRRLGVALGASPTG